jgi:hypothetical protein
MDMFGEHPGSAQIEFVDAPELGEGGAEQEALSDSDIPEFDEYDDEDEPDAEESGTHTHGDPPPARTAATVGQVIPPKRPDRAESTASGQTQYARAVAGLNAQDRERIERLGIKPVARSAEEAKTEMTASGDTLLVEMVTTLERIKGAADSLNPDAIAKGIMSAVSGRLSSAFSWRERLRWLSIGAAIAAAVFVCGLFLGRSLDLGGYRERYAARTQSLPHAAAVLRSPAREEILDLVSRNDSATLRDLARCAAGMGLRRVRSTSGVSVCAGAGADRGFYPIP